MKIILRGKNEGYRVIYQNDWPKTTFLPITIPKLNQFQYEADRPQDLFNKIILRGENEGHRVICHNDGSFTTFLPITIPKLNRFQFEADIPQDLSNTNILRGEPESHRVIYQFFAHNYTQTQPISI